MKRKVLTALALSVLCFVSFAGCGGNSGGTGDENEPDPDRDQTLAENYDFGDPESWAGERLQRADLGDCTFDVFPEDHRYDWGQSILYDTQEKTYKMWWCRHSRYDSIWYAESDDMKNWHSLQKVLVVEPGQDTTWLKMHVGKPAVIKVQNGGEYEYRMYFEAPATLKQGGSIEYNNNVFYATSADGKSWNIWDNGTGEPYPIIRMSDEQIENSNQQSADRGDSYGYYGFGQPSITEKDGVYYIYYTHSLINDFMYVATSTDGIHFSNHKQVFNRAACGVKYNTLLDKFMFTWTYDNKVYYMESDDGLTFEYANMTEAMEHDADTISIGRSKVRGYSDFVSDEAGHVTTHTAYCAYMEGVDPGNGQDFRLHADTWDIHLQAVNVKEYANRTMVLPNGRIKTKETAEVYTNKEFVYQKKQDGIVKSESEKQTLNGKKDAFYDGASELAIDRVSYADCAVPGEIGATVYAKYTDGNLYLLVAVKDQTADDDDYVTILLDEKHKTGEQADVSYIDFRRGETVARFMNGDGETIAGESKYLRTQEGYHLELKLPWRSAVQKGVTVGFDCYVYNRYDSEEFKTRICYNESLLYLSQRTVNTAGELTLL